MLVLGYKFDNEFYADTAEGQQELLDSVYDAVTTEAGCDTAVATEDVDSVIAATFENTVREGTSWGVVTFWENCETMNRDSHYPLNIERVTDESAPELVAECKEWLNMD